MSAIDKQIDEGEAAVPAKKDRFGCLCKETSAESRRRRGGSRGREPRRRGRSQAFEGEAEPEPEHSNERFKSASNSFLGGYQRAGANPRARRTAASPWANRNKKGFIFENENWIFASTQSKSKGINFDTYDNIEIELSGEGSSQIEIRDYFMDYAKDISPLLLKNIERVNYDKLTPVQRYAIPVLLTGRDLMACAQTGSGKTAAFLFPIIANMLAMTPPERTIFDARLGEPVALVIAPTRELTVQIAGESRKFAFGTGIATVVIYGGSDIMEQAREVNRGCDICVGTPGRLIDLFTRSRISFISVRILVLDEADRMLDMGFIPQISRIIHEFDMPCENRQTMMFSATFPKEIQRLASKFMQNYLYLAVGRVGSTSAFIAQTFQYVPEDQKSRKLQTLLKESCGKTLVFVETKAKADSLEYFLNNNHINAISIHGDKTQQERNYSLEAFVRGRNEVLVATDVASRGLDIHSITRVINYDLPNNIDDYVHRIGRTGRAGNSGQALSFVHEGNRIILRPLINLLEESKQEIPAWLKQMMSHCSSSGFGGRGGGNRFGGGARAHHDFSLPRTGRSNFGGQDMRRDVESHKNRIENGNDKWVLSNIRYTASGEFW